MLKADIHCISCNGTGTLSDYDSVNKIWLDIECDCLYDDGVCGECNDTGIIEYWNEDFGAWLEESCKYCKICP